MNKITLNRIDNQKGAALITALIFLVILTMLAMSSMKTNILDEKMAANTQEKNRAFQMAETTLTIALNNNLAFNTSGYSDSVADVGSYAADADYESEFLEEKDAASVFQSGAAITGSSGGQKYSYFNLSITATTESGASSTINAGAWHL